MPRDKESILQDLLVTRCKRGDRQAFCELVQMWEKRLFFYVRKLVASEEDAWDVLQQTWLKAVQGIRGLSNPRSLAAWLYKIARLTAISHWRGHYRERAHVSADVELAQIAEEPDDPGLEDAEEVTAALGRISIDHREVLTLYFLNDLSLDEIATVLEIPEGTVKSRLCYAKLALRSALQEGGAHA